MRGHLVVEIEFPEARQGGAKAHGGPDEEVGRDARVLGAEGVDGPGGDGKLVERLGEVEEAEPGGLGDDELVVEGGGIPLVGGKEGRGDEEGGVEGEVVEYCVGSEIGKV